MIRRNTIQLAASAFAGVLVCSATSSAWAQQASTAAGSASRPRSTDERVNTESATPPPINSDYRRAAEGTLPAIPGGAVPATGGAIDPAVRPFGNGTGNLAAGAGTGAGIGAGLGSAMPAGMDVAMLIEHAVSMGIEGSTLAALAEANKPDAAGNDAVKALMTHAQDELRGSKDLMTKAAAAGNSVDGNSPVRKFYGAANNYMTTLAMLSTPGTMDSPNDKAQMSAINHAVKGVLDAGHILQFGGAPGAAPALEALTTHARMMKDEGTKALDQLAGTSPVDPAAPLSPSLLAQRGRDLINAASSLAPMGQMMGGMNGMGGMGGQNGRLGAGLPNPGRLQDNRPEIIGGTYGTGSPTAGTATGAEAARNVQNSTEGPNGTLNVPTPSGAPGSGPSGYGVGNNNTPPTQSTTGPRPR